MDNSERRELILALSIDPRTEDYPIPSAEFRLLRENFINGTGAINRAIDELLERQKNIDLIGERLIELMQEPENIGTNLAAPSDRTVNFNQNPV